MSTASTQRCGACGADVPPGADRCPRCGTSQHMDLCPHCGATSGVTADAELRFRCDVCGGPRIPPSPRGARSGSEVPALRKAQEAVSGRSRGRAGAVAGGILLGADVLFLILWLIIAGAGLGFFLASLFTFVPLALFTAWAVARARARGREIEPALDAAWLAAATDVAARSEDTLTTRDLARDLKIEQAQAEELMALLEVSDVVRSSVTSDGDMVYSQRLRVGGVPAATAPMTTQATAPATASTAGAHDAARADEAAVAAEEEALAAEEAAMQERGRGADVDASKK
ncbi:zinc ribbon domain-containing protein [Chondromyces apiculatus]|uniref:DZANK-type domain-containing protein n=1 Tax=Chondromyces apiculatus DSM 436 TaxID=1192034 RepID=A0A017T5W9_9BACT|nr:zinc ribbon domain-containing protein [Chondromyces apiculatus]EYF04422.1 Hypothetical protein CAP_4561 [Chondromyces apiculatus DSM 436]